MRILVPMSLALGLLSSVAFAKIDEQAILRKSVEAYAGIESMQKLVAVVNDTLTDPKDKEFLKSYAREHASATLPKVTVVQDRIQISQDSQVVNLKFSDMKKSLVTINSQSVDLNFELPLKQRLNRIDELMKMDSKTSGFELLPKAYAGGWIAVGLVALMIAGSVHDSYYAEYLTDLKARLTKAQDRCLELEKNTTIDRSKDNENDKRNRAIWNRFRAITEQTGGSGPGSRLLILASFNNFNKKGLNFHNLESLASDTTGCYARLLETHAHLSDDDIQLLKTEIAPIELEFSVRHHYVIMDDPLTTR